ncbi:MAG: FAD-dependent oxidoreductase [Verrucomicrobiales bacterium]|nr:FAD-dependent oxidoreductase [Verrucomicrobiales bacterium]
MKNLLILGAGTAGTMMAHHLRKRLPRGEWRITAVDRSEDHYYQPGFLFLPFGMIDESAIVKKTRDLLPRDVDFVAAPVERIDPAARQVHLAGREPIAYDLLIVATGSHIAPEETEGMTGPGWRRDVFDFYTFEGARALRDRLAAWQGGKLVVHVTEMPIKCPVAPLEFSFLADTFFQNRGLRDRVEITYVTPLSGAFTKPKASKALGHLLADKGIALEADFAIERVDADRRVIVSYDEREIPYDLLVTTPLNMGSEAIAASGMGDDLNFIPTHRHTLQSRDYPDIFVIGDATNVPASKAGSVAHFEAETLTDNILLHIAGRPLKEEFDGHSNCFIESGGGKALLIDFSYDIEPHEGGFPFGWGPLRLLRESRLNHWGKLAFRWVYWHLLLKARPLPGISRNKRVPKDLRPAA